MVSATVGTIPPCGPLPRPGLPEGHGRKVVHEVVRPSRKGRHKCFVYDLIHILRVQDAGGAKSPAGL